MKLFNSKKRMLAVGLTAALAVGVAGGAYAFFNTTGSGTGTATTGSAAPLTNLNGTLASTLYPGTTSAVSFTVDNSSPGHQHVGTISLSSVDAPAGCDGADFTMVPVNADQDVANGTLIPITAGGVVTYANNGDQSLCQGKSITLHFSSN